MRLIIRSFMYLAAFIIPILRNGAAGALASVRATLPRPAMNLRSSRLLAVVALISLSLLSVAAPRPVHAGELCSPVTNQCVGGRFLQYWEENGGLSIFGHPISPAREERNRDTGKTYLTQWFERNRFEYHPENAAPYDVLLGRLGADRLQQLGHSWQAEGRESGPKTGCLWFAQTGHNVCDQNPNGAVAGDRGFMSYWQAEGLADSRLSAYARSLALHGLPLTAARMETNSSGHTVLTQWFERGRFEWHPNNPPGFHVLLGLLGNELRGSPPGQALKWFWPNPAPIGLSVMPEQSWSTEVMWMLQLGEPHATRPSVTISGNVAGEAPGSKVRDVTVRGQRGTLFRGSTGYAVLWSEGGLPYAVVGRSEQEVLGIAAGLEEIDRATWQRRAGPN